MLPSISIAPADGCQIRRTSQTGSHVRHSLAEESRQPPVRRYTVARTAEICTVHRCSIRESGSQGIERLIAIREGIEIDHGESDLAAHSRPCHLCDSHPDE